MESRHIPDDDMDWNDPTFSSNQFEELMNSDSPYGNSAFHDFTNIDSPAFAVRTPSQAGREAAAAIGAQYGAPPVGLPAGASTESSSQDSSSDTSSRRKRKVTESPVSDPATEVGVPKEDSMLDLVDTKHPRQQHHDQFPTRPMHNLSLDQEHGMGAFDFDSAASSPVQAREYNSHNMSLNAQVRMPTSTMAAQYQSPVQTINPGMFQMPSRDQSPVTTTNMFNTTSPNPVFSNSTPSSDSNEIFNGNPSWPNGMVQNPSWPGEYNGQLASPGALGFTPSPVVNGATPSVTSRSSAPPLGRSPLHIAPIATKSRVETQINVNMTLEKPPPGVEHLHLPLHTIAKSKLLAKEDVDQSKVLELHTMLVCTSAMHNPQFKEKALQRAAAQNNLETQRRAEQLRGQEDGDKNDHKTVAEEDKPLNGGEVRICDNCILRERKRAGRKKLKKEEEQQHWERFETERVVVFNSNEYLPFKPAEQAQAEVGASPGEIYTPPDGSLQVMAAMRIACYCRHQSEKEGFRVIFTLKDQQGNVVAQQMSDSILITDDHKTHPQSFSTTMANDGFYPNMAYAPNGLPSSHSMVDMPSQLHHFTSSRSTGNLQALNYGQQQFNPHSHIHQLPHSGYTSQATSATMTPTSLSRPASPSSAGQSGPNKKRKSSGFHRRVPSGLTMTPRVDTSQPPSANMPSAASAISPFSPSGEFAPQTNQPYMTIPTASGHAQYFGSGPPTPSENLHQHQQYFNPAQLEQHIIRNQNAPAYFSHPSSAVPSRSTSPVLQQTRPNLASYARQPIQTSTNSMQNRQPVYQQQPTPGSAGGDAEIAFHPPTITKITPAEGPTTGGTEVSIYGYNFTNGARVMFGELEASTTFYGPQALLAVSPPSRPGGVNVSLLPPTGQQHAFSSPPSNRQVFTYTDKDPKMMEYALKFAAMKATGNQGQWGALTNQYANQYISSHVQAAGIRDQGYGGGGGGGGGNMMMAQHDERRPSLGGCLNGVGLGLSQMNIKGMA